VLQLGFDRVEYAEGILQVCRSYLKSPACVAGVSGSNLKKRIEAIMEDRMTKKLTLGKRVLLTLAGAGAFVVPIVTGMLNAAELQVPVVPELQLPVIERTVSAALPVLSQAPAPAPRQTPPVPAVQVEPPTSAVRVEILPVIQGGALSIIPVISQVSVSPAPQIVPPKPYDELLMILADEEGKAFQQLMREEERQNFIRNFWLARDPTPGTPANEFRDEYFRRIAYANEHFTTKSGIPGSQTDRGKMYIITGPPDAIEPHPTGGTYQSPIGGVVTTSPYETWRYRRIDGKGIDLIYEFVDKQGNGNYALEYDPAAKLK
jgi:GWxTD domain-containing protein